MITSIKWQKVAYIHFFFFSSFGDIENSYLYFSMDGATFVCLHQKRGVTEDRKKKNDTLMSLLKIDWILPPGLLLLRRFIKKFKSVPLWQYGYEQNRCSSRWTLCICETFSVLIASCTEFSIKTYAVFFYSLFLIIILTHFWHSISMIFSIFI